MLCTLRKMIFCSQLRKSITKTTHVLYLKMESGPREKEIERFPHFVGGRRDKDNLGFVEVFLSPFSMMKESVTKHR